MQTFNTNKSETSVFRTTNLLEILGCNTRKVETADSMNKKQENSSNEEVPNRWRSPSRHGEAEKKGERREKGERERSEKRGFNFFRLFSVCT